VWHTSPLDHHASFCLAQYAAAAALLHLQEPVGATVGVGNTRFPVGTHLGCSTNPPAPSLAVHSEGLEWVGFASTHVAFIESAD